MRSSITSATVDRGRVITNQEAINILLNERKCIDRNDGVQCDRKCELYDLVMDAEPIREAYNMAISALKAQDAHDINADTISRQVAIDTDGLDEEIRCEMCKNPTHTDRGCDGNCRYDEKLYKKIIQLLNKRITPLPPAQPDSCEFYDTESHFCALHRPSAQPEIIQCEECKHHSHDAGYGYDWCNRTSGVFRVKPEDFCSRAERREE